jgi:hypothetical protein
MKTRLTLAVLVLLALAASASAQTKASGTLQCAKPEMQSLDAGDKPGHMYMISKASCTWPKPMDIGGQPAKEGVSVQSAEVSGGKSSGSGTHLGTVEGGDKYMVHFSSKATLDQNGAAQTASGTWSYTGGTGKLKGIQGKGTYKATGPAAADGSQSFEVEGEYTMPAAKPAAKK